MKVVKTTYQGSSSSTSKGIIWGKTKQEATEELRKANAQYKANGEKITKVETEVIIVRPSSEALVHFLRASTPRFTT